ncbi:MAG TPA: BTAD domain-containing putative transcriptional regulator [Solirubrobacteraceae bacterium]|jgi:DNA-binding SARP family transcriptional activator|nr:BTAD domain-containing putative transcriptional regulator [Solirubrobacteraceae bacterium]
MATVAGEQTDRHAGARTRRRFSLESEAFSAFPYGLFVLDGAGRVVCRNAEATRLIESLGLAEAKLTCCTLLGCRVPETVLEAACVTELALGRDAPLPEIRVDIRSPAGADAMWVTAAAIGGAGKRVVLQLRPGVSGDRRRRTSPHWMAGARLRIRALGTTSVESGEGPIGGAWLDQRAGQLLKYLVAERRRAVAVDEIGENIWPGADYAVGTSVRYYVHALRRRLEPQRGSREPSAFILVGSGTYRLALEHVEVDADEFEAHVSAGLAIATTSPQAAATELERGLAIYRGEFLAELPYAEWALDERHRLHDLACLGLRRLADIRLELRVLDGAARALERLATLQPFDEDVHRQLMELDIMRGRRSDAVRRYTALRSRLRRTFGQEPNFTLSDLAHPRL